MPDNELPGSGPAAGAVTDFERTRPLPPATLSQPPVLAIAGPTAAGKSALALQLWERLHGQAEIVSVDSAQVYRGMDIGTAKPDATTRTLVPHHLLDLLDPAETYSAARFAEDARRVIGEIRGRGRWPLLVGGTMLYFRALLQGLSDLPPADPELRARLEAEAAAHGWEALHRRLAEVDPETAARLHPNDAQRIQRALEICELSGEPASHRFKRRPAEGWTDQVVRVAVCPPSRPELHQRIERRFLAMIELGFVDEVARLRRRGDLHPDLPSMRAVGYRQLWRHLDGEYGLDRAIEQGLAATRQYAKRQLTWLRGESGWHWLDPGEPNAAAEVLNLAGSARP
ncbi:MAG: tRNA (adenosine(37)-N6)-dimethylallyltransferase MiaA [Nevskia sp.]|nr:tRNA (adenosine(37)-N6)-dimethylallyltransferase MiaA [Nevskia sp.]